MKAPSFALLLASLAPALLPTPAQAQPPGEGYVLLFEDNFDGDKVREEDWVYRSDRRGGEANFSSINGLNRKENVRVAGGELIIRVDHEEVNGKKEFTGGGLITRKRFGYGYYESRYRAFMKGNHGVHTAFWQRGPLEKVLAGQKLDPTSPVENVLFEIDSSELDNPVWISTNNLYDVIAPKGMTDGYPWPARFHIPVTPLEGGWFVDAYDYNPRGIIFYDNGREVARIDYDRIRGQQNVWLTALNGFGTNIDTSVFPGESSFDYFRYYAKDYPGFNLVANEGFEYNLDSVDPQNPIAWLEEGQVEASLVTGGEGTPSPGSSRLRHAASEPYQVTTSQTLQFILDGGYHASAMVRSSGGQKVARMRVGSPGEEVKFMDIPATPQWTRISLENIPVKNHEATIAFVSEAGAGQWLEVDDVQFFKPLNGSPKPLPAKPFQVLTDPIWNILPGHPMVFGDKRFGFFGREVGVGGAFTALLTMRPSKAIDQVVLERFPKKGAPGWCIRLQGNGSLIFRIGTAEKFQDLTVPRAWAAGRQTRVACLFDRGRATVFIDGRPAGSISGLPAAITDKTAAGSFGVHRTSTKEPYFGELQDVRIHNRALTVQEINRPTSRRER